MCPRPLTLAFATTHDLTRPFPATLVFPSLWLMAQNNVLCRRQYLPLAEMNPAAHCRALGPSGGGRCVPHGLSSQYLVKSFIAC
jgi:hypothetical protein